MYSGAAAPALGPALHNDRSIGVFRDYGHSMKIHLEQSSMNLTAFTYYSSEMYLVESFQAARLGILPIRESDSPQLAAYNDFSAKYFGEGLKNLGPTDWSHQQVRPE